MSQEFIALRARARDKRDKAIAAARRDYEASLVLIANLEQDLLGRESSRHKKISACIESQIPSDRPFTTTDIMAGLEALDSGRVWRKRSIDNHLSRLRERGIVRRLKRHRGVEPSTYVRVGVEVAGKDPFGDQSLAEVIPQVLVRPMSATELTVRLLEAGWQSSMTRKALRDHVGVELRGGPFKRDGGKWTPQESL